jgi:hypothetical protein
MELGTSLTWWRGGVRSILSEIGYPVFLGTVRHALMAG